MLLRIFYNTLAYILINFCEVDNMQGNMKLKTAADCHFKILVLQMITVAVVLISAIIIRIFGGDLYTYLSSLYHEKFDEITSTSFVMDEEKEKEENEKENDSNDVNADLYDADVDSSLKENITEFEQYESKNVSVSAQSFLFPVDGEVVSEYGMRTNPVTNIYTLHGGMDIAADTGTPIYSAYEGAVSAAGYSDTYGYYVVVAHTSEIKTLYAHCSELLVEKGETVKKGDRIALVGNTGRSTGPHLHFEVRVGDSRINPRWILGEIIKV